MFVTITDSMNRLIACINTDGDNNILLNGTKHFVTPTDNNITFVESDIGILAYPKVNINMEE